MKMSLLIGHSRLSDRVEVNFSPKLISQKGGKVFPKKKQRNGQFWKWRNLRTGSSKSLRKDIQKCSMDWKQLLITHWRFNSAFTVKKELAVLKPLSLGKRPNSDNLRFQLLAKPMVNLFQKCPEMCATRNNWKTHNHYQLNGVVKALLSQLRATSSSPAMDLDRSCRHARVWWNFDPRCYHPMETLDSSLSTNWTLP